MRLRAEAMLKIEEIMSLLPELDRNMVAFEVFRTYGNTRLTPVENTRKTRARNTQETLGLGGAIGGNGSVSEKNRQLNEQAKEILEFLNVKAGKSFQPVDENLRFIRARLAKHSIEDIKGVIARKTREWLNTEQALYLRPKTLFAATNFANYIGEQPRV